LGLIAAAFYQLHRKEVLDQYRNLQVGVMEGSIDQPKPYIPYTEPSHLQGYYSPYYKYTDLTSNSHLEFRKRIREFIRNELFGNVKLDDTNPPASDEVFKRMGETGFLACSLGPGRHLQGYPLFGLCPDQLDYFHELIVHEELASMGQPGYRESLGSGLKIGLPPVIYFAKSQLRERIVPEALSGRKRICLAISEPSAGSDVTGIRTQAVRTACGKFFLVNGVKKWITNGMSSDYFTTAVRTGPGKTDISVLLIERNGVETKPIKTSHNVSTGTAYVIFEDIKVPVENLLGKENNGLKVILYNFNHERWIMIVAIIAATRLVVAECIKFANQHQRGRKRLIEDTVTRNKIAHMVSRVEAIHCWLENITFQMNNMAYEEQSQKLAGPLALLKYQTTRVSQFVKDQSVQLFVEHGITQTGLGRIVESFMRTQKFGAILGGSEEIMADLGIRQALKSFPNARL
jgi:alkylation response protein AidB-like acyl-CoA dehydrogenase